MVIAKIYKKYGVSELSSLMQIGAILRVKFAQTVYCFFMYINKQQRFYSLPKRYKQIRRFE